MSILGSIFGTSDIIKSGMKLIDDIHTSDEEEILAKSKAKVDLMKAYQPFKLAQRYIAFAFTGVFIFILLNGVLGSIYGIVDMENVRAAKEFADEMWLGQIMVTIIGLYFGGGFIESKKNG